MIRINLLPEEERKKKKAAKKLPKVKIPIPSFRIRIPLKPSTFLIGFIVIVILIAFVVIWVRQIGETRKLTKEIDQMNTRLRSLQKEINLVKDLEKKQADLQKRLDVIKGLSENRFLRVKILDELASALPEYVWLTSFEDKIPNFKIEGLAFSNLTVADFMNRLEDSEYLTDVDLTTLRKTAFSGQDVMQFILSVNLKSKEKK